MKQFLMTDPDTFTHSCVRDRHGNERSANTKMEPSQDAVMTDHDPDL